MIEPDTDTTQPGRTEQSGAGNDGGDGNGSGGGGGGSGGGGQGGGGQGGGGPGGTSPSLSELLDSLMAKRPDAVAAQVDADIADLTKLIAEVETAKAGYSKEAHAKLKAEEEYLKLETGKLSDSLKAALGPKEIDAIEQIEKNAVEEVRAARAAADKARKDTEAKEGALADAQQDHAAAKARLDIWRKPADSIGKRLKQAQALLTQSKELRNGPHRGEAYWRLAMGEFDELADEEFLHLVLKLPPPIVPPDELEAKIVAAWGRYKQTRSAAVRAGVELENARAKQKAAEAVHAARSKSLVKAIADALAKREAAPNAA